MQSDSEGFVMGKLKNNALMLLKALLCALALMAAGPQAYADGNEGTAIPFQAAIGLATDAKIQDVCCADYFADETLAKTTARPRPGVTATWVRISKPLPGGLIQILPTVDRATLYSAGPDGSWHTAETGDLVASAAKLFPSPFMVLPLPGAFADGPLYLRIEQQVPVLLSIRHWTVPAFLAMQSRDQVLKLLLLGFVGAMIFYNLFVSAIVRDPAFALNAVTISALLVIALYLSGYGAAYVWDGAPELSNIILFASIIAAIVVGGTFIWMFVRSTGEPVTRGWPLFIAPVLAILLAIAGSVIPLWLATLLALGLGAVLFVIALSVCLGRAFKGELKPRIILFPLVFVMIPGSILVALDDYFGMRFRQLGSNGMEITLCLEAIIFSLALASRIRITEREARKASERVVALQNEAAVRNITAQDKERRRLSKELHDGVGQEFLVVLGGLKKLISTSEAGVLSARLKTLVDAAGSALNNLRQISRDMHPAGIEHLGLARALEELTKQTQGAAGVNINLSVDYDESALNADQRLHLYRIVQECLSNVLRHSNADTCWIALGSTLNDEVRLTVEDDGNGFGAATSKTGILSPGIGLTSIDERVRACGGQWHKCASTHGGACIMVTLPQHKTRLEAV